MKKFQILIILSLVGGAIALNGCGNASDTTATTSAPSDISSLPKATGAVASSGSSLTGSLRDKETLRYNIAASTTGIKLSAWSSATWGAGTSRAMCQVGSIVRDSYREAGKADKILCYIGNMEKGNLFTNSYDGNDHYYSFSPSNSGTAMRIKFNITKTSGVISSFKMWMCQDASTQDGYISETFTGTSVAMSAKELQTNTDNSSTFSWKNAATVTGSVNSTGTWTSKAIAVDNSGTVSGGSITPFTSSQHVDVTQGASTLTVSGWRSGSFNSQSFSDQFYSLVQGISMGKMSTFAIGDGSAKYTGSFNGATATTSTTSWTGDSKALLTTASDGPYYASANAGTLPTVGTVTIAFSGAEIWNCSPPSGTSFTTPDMTRMFTDSTLAAAMNACDATYGGNDDQTYVDCHNGS